MSAEAWRSPDASGAEVGRSLRGFGLSLLVRDLPAEVAFLTGGLLLPKNRESADFAILSLGDAALLLHRDAAYAGHPLLNLLPEAGARGAGAELRLYEVDPDAAWARAEAAGGLRLREPLDRPHGLRECVILSPAGYAWVPSRPLQS